MPKKTPIGTRVRFLVDVYDMDEATNQPVLIVRAGEMGTVVRHPDGSFSDWPDVELDGSKRVVVADISNREETEVL